MDVAFTRLSMWLWGGREEEPVTSKAASMSSSFDFGLGFREPDAVKLTSAKRSVMRPRRIKRKWQSREERKMDKEYDVVLVSSDGGCLSGSESDDSDWSIGWLEPHAPEFQNESDGESSFAVIVQCYGRGQGDRSEIASRIDVQRPRNIWRNFSLLCGTAEVPTASGKADRPCLMLPSLAECHNLRMLAKKN